MRLKPQSDCAHLDNGAHVLGVGQQPLYLLSVLSHHLLRLQQRLGARCYDAKCWGGGRGDGGAGGRGVRKE